MDYVTDKQQELSDALLRMIRVASRDLCVIEGKITGVSEDNRTCDISVGDSNSSVPFSNVLLEILTTSDASFTLIPNLNSDCLVCFRDGNQDRPQIIKCQSVAKIVANPTDLFQFNTGENGGLVLVNPLADVLNKIISDINTIKGIFEAWIPVPNDGGQALKDSSAPWSGNDIDPIDPTDLENPNVTQ